MIRIDYHSGIYTLQAEQVLPISVETAWDFFSAPANLAAITPPHMGFHITSPPSGRMFPGQVITYAIAVAPGLRTAWVTEISQVSQGRYFVDEQRFGPFAWWHHQHWFESEGEGTRLRDRVSYKLPFGWAGRLMHPVIRRQLTAVFAYRHDALARRFPEAEPPTEISSNEG